MFPQQIKELTNKYELIAPTNKLGHGVSYSVLKETLTKVPYEKTQSTKENEVAVPENCIKERITSIRRDSIW